MPINVSTKQATEPRPSWWRSDIILGAILLFLLGLVPLATVPRDLLDFAPLSLVTVIPTFLAGPFVGAMGGAAIAPAVFILVSGAILKGITGPSRTTLAVFIIVVVLAYLSAALDFNNTIRFTSLRRAIALSLECLVPPIVLIVVFLWTRDHLTLRRSLVLHWFGLAWFAWSAFPWWGELL